MEDDKTEHMFACGCGVIHKVEIRPPLKENNSIATSELNEIDVDGRETMGVFLIGTARRQPDGTWRCLAQVDTALCVVQVSVRLPQEQAKSVVSHESPER